MVNKWNIQNEAVKVVVLGEVTMNQNFLLTGISLTAEIYFLF